MHQCDLEGMQARVSRGNMKPTDIKHKDVLSRQQIQDIPLPKVYQWVRTGEWKPKDFMKWAKAVRLIEG